MEASTPKLRIVSDPQPDELAQRRASHGRQVSRAELEDALSKAVVVIKSLHDKNDALEQELAQAQVALDERGRRG